MEILQITLNNIQMGVGVATILGSVISTVAVINSSIAKKLNQKADKTDTDTRFKELERRADDTNRSLRDMNLKIDKIYEILIKRGGN